MENAQVKKIEKFVLMLQKKVLCECNIGDDLKNPQPIDLNKIF